MKQWYEDWKQNGGKLQRVNKKDLFYPTQCFNPISFNDGTNPLMFSEKGKFSVEVYLQDNKEFNPNNLIAVRVCLQNGDYIIGLTDCLMTAVFNAEFIIDWFLDNGIDLQRTKEHLEQGKELDIIEEHITTDEEILDSEVEGGKKLKDVLKDKNFMLSLGQNHACEWGGECYNYSVNNENRSVDFHCIEHGEKFITDMSLIEVKHHWDKRYNK